MTEKQKHSEKCPFCSETILAVKMYDKCKHFSQEVSSHNPYCLSFDQPDHSCGEFILVRPHSENLKLFEKYRDKAVKENRLANGKGKKIIWAKNDIIVFCDKFVTIPAKNNLQ